MLLGVKNSTHRASDYTVVIEASASGPHRPIDNLGMPGMTMVFQVQDPGLIDQVKAGDKVKFAADKIGGAFTVTRIEAVN